MTYAERSKATEERDDEHMIYEMGSLSQYEDGSALECETMTTYTAEEIFALAVPIQPEPAAIFGHADRYLKDLKRNARAATKYGKTGNRAPFVNW